MLYFLLSPFSLLALSLCLAWPSFSWYFFHCVIFPTPSPTMEAQWHFPPGSAVMGAVPRHFYRASTFLLHILAAHWGLPGILSEYFWDSTVLSSWPVLCHTYSYFLFSLYCFEINPRHLWRYFSMDLSKNTELFSYYYDISSKHSHF